VAANNHCGLALYAHIQNEETWVHKKQNFGAHHKVSVEKVLLILIVTVKWSSLESRGAWIVMSQGTPNHMYEVKHPFTKYANCTWSKHCVEIYVNTKLQLFWCTHMSL
jgi:hypothetical protein